MVMMEKYKLQTQFGLRWCTAVHGLLGLACFCMLCAGGCASGRDDQVSSEFQGRKSLPMKPTSPGETRVRGDSAEGDVDALLSPLQLGLRRDELEPLLPAYEAFGMLVTPSRFAEGGEVTLPSGVVAWFAFDPQNRVDYISSRDPRLRLQGGVGVGTTLEELKTKLPNVQPVQLPGYGVVAQVSPTDWVVFFPDDEEGLLPSSRVRWIEFRHAEPLACQSSR